MNTTKQKIILYVKTHNTTGLKYFGKTVNSNPFLYKGSGTYWKWHIKKYGYNVTTEIIGIYDNKEKCLEDALKFSIENNIVESTKWANLILESLDGGDTSNTENYIKSLDKIKMNSKNNKWWNNGKHQVFCETPPDSSYERGRLKYNNVGSTIGSDIQRGKIWVNNSSIEMMVVSDQIPKGFVKGRIKEKCFSNGTKRAKVKGTHWWNNGTIEKMSKIQPDETFIQGRLKSK